MQVCVCVRCVGVFVCQLCVASLLACHLLNQAKMMTAAQCKQQQKTEMPNNEKAFSVGVAWLLISLKHMTGSPFRESGGGGCGRPCLCLRSKPKLTLFDFHYLFSYRRTSQISCKQPTHTHTYTHAYTHIRSW